MLHSKTEVARLPHPVREQINELIHDGTPFEDILRWLGAQLITEITEASLVRWKEGGYQDWLAHQQKLDALHAQAEQVQALAAMDQALYQS